MQTLSPNLRAALFMTIAMAGYVVNDAFMKLSSSDLNLFQAIFIRGLFTCVMMALLARYYSAFVSWPQVKAYLSLPALWLRMIGELGATYLFLTALFHLPIANVTAVIQLLPLVITLAAAFFLSETVGWRRYLAIATGFFGVLIITRPGSDSFNSYSFYVLGAVAFFALRDIATRRLPKDVPSLFVSLLTAINICALGLVGSFFQPWQPVGNYQILLLACAASALIFGYIFSIMAMREGDIGFVSPFRYSILIWALALGYFVFGDVPDRYELVGATIVVASGLFVFYRERNLQQDPQVVEKAESD